MNFVQQYAICAATIAYTANDFNVNYVIYSAITAPGNELQCKLIAASTVHKVKIVYG